VTRGSTLRHLEHLMVACALTWCAAVVGFAFMLRAVLPLEAAVVVFAAVSVWALAAQSMTRLSLLPRFMILLYAVCFSVTAGHLFDRYYVWWHTPAASALIRERAVSAEMMAVGLVGLLGLIVGMRLAQAFCHPGVAPPSPRAESTLGRATTAALAAAAVGLSWITAAKATIFTAAYNTGGSAIAAAPLNFNAAWLLSYVTIVVLVIDCERERSDRLRRFKRAAIGIAVAIIVVFLQVLRGDRECSGLLVALAFLYLTGSDSARRLQWTSDLLRRVRGVAVPAVIVFLVFLILGAVRVSLATAQQRQRLSIYQSFLSTLQENTWSSILLTNLAQSAQFRSHTAHYLYGETYADYVKSLPPGIVTRALGIERPIEPSRGPNWWFFGISAGGIHAVVIPFRNFGMPGAFFVLMLYGWFIAWIEIRNDPRVFWARLLYGATCVGSFFWFWYGDMTMIRALMSAAVVGPLYRGWLQVGRAFAMRPHPTIAHHH
jgi:hypothetical protein